MFQIRRAGWAAGLSELAAVSDGLALAFGLANRATPALGAGVAAIILRTAARFLPGDSGRPQA
jgi:hypothetical protein